MKKYLYIILSFSVCMFLLTLYLIGNANDKNKNIERGIDLYSTYDMKDVPVSESSKSKFKALCEKALAEQQ